MRVSDGLLRCRHISSASKSITRTLATSLDRLEFVTFRLINPDGRTRSFVSIDHSAKPQLCIDWEGSGHRGMILDRSHDRWLPARAANDSVCSLLAARLNGSNLSQLTAIPASEWRRAKGEIRHSHSMSFVFLLEFRVWHAGGVTLLILHFPR